MCHLCCSFQMEMKVLLGLTLLFTCLGKLYILFPSAFPSGFALRAISVSPVGSPWSCSSPGCQTLLWPCMCCIPPSCRSPPYTGCKLHWMCPVWRLQGFERSRTASPSLNTGRGFQGIDFGSARGRQLPWSSPLANICHFQLLSWSRPTELVWEAAALCIHYSQGSKQTLGAWPGPCPG